MNNQPVYMSLGKDGTSKYLMEKSNIRLNIGELQAVLVVVWILLFPPPSIVH